MVGEFPELQGVMGGYYARALPSPLMGEGPGMGVTPVQDKAAGGVTLTPDPSPIKGEGSALANAIRDHYKPQGPADTVPTDPLTVAVALADKLDTLVGFFAIGETPTGSKDPFALRRAALGVIRLVLENGVRASIRDLSGKSHRAFIASFTRASALMFKTTSNSFWAFSEQELTMNTPADDAFWWVNTDRLGKSFDPYDAAAVLKGQFDTSTHVRFAEQGEIEAEVAAFFADRLKVLLRDQGQRHDLVDAVFARIFAVRLRSVVSSSISPTSAPA